MQHTQGKGTRSLKRILCFLLMLTVLLSVLSVCLSGIVSVGAEDIDLVSSESNYTQDVTDYTAPVESGSHGNATWVDAVYYDYLSDAEFESGWLNPIDAGTGFGGSKNDWFEHKIFNSYINALVDDSWRFPLFFGNLCSDRASFEGTIPGHHDEHRTDSIGYFGHYVTGLKNFDYAVNDSNGLFYTHDEENEVTDYNYSVAGLAYEKLDNSGNIQYADGKAMPYFSTSFLSQQYNGKTIGKTVKSFFPFREDSSSGVQTYIFNSKGAQDNVFFNWENDRPTSVGYGASDHYGISDGNYKFNGEGHSAGYGIFPFNNKVGNGSGHNNNLDYGFGIKINMDFRVPEYGTVNGAANGNAVTFEYSGDDDLWVYLSEYDDSGNLTNSELVLDLGGNHKEATGRINFKDMKSYTDKCMTPTETGKRRDRIYIENSYNWNEIWVWAWNNDSDGKWYKAQWDESSNAYYVGASWGPYGDESGDRFDSKSRFLCTKGKDDWASQTKTDDLAAHWGKKTYIDNLHYCSDYAVNYSYETNKETVIHNGENLDPDKTYHLTVFYMERGYIESNCMMKFTMTPVKNNLKVTKTIHADNINSAGLQNDIKAIKLDFKNTVNNTQADTYQLSDGGSKEFTKYNTGSSVSVTETKKSKGVVWDMTYWELIDNNNNGNVLDSDTYEADPHGTYQTTTSTKTFALKDPRNENNNAKLQVNFENWPAIGAPVTMTKSVKDDPDNTDEFGFTFLVNINGNDYSTAPREFVGYDLSYQKTTQTDTGSATTTETMSGGHFTVTQKDTVTITGLPVGATYVLIEDNKEGYETRTPDTGIISRQSTAIEVENTPLKGTGVLSVKKLITSNGVDHLYQNGSLFSFKAEGLPVITSVSTVAAAGSQEVSQTNGSGQAVFSAKSDNTSDPFLKFNKPGKYAYKITETKINATSDHDPDHLVTYPDDIAIDTKTIFALIDVYQDTTATGSSLKVRSTTYYSDAGFTNVLDNPEFMNPVRLGSVRINKLDSGSDNGTYRAQKLDGATFTLYKVSAKDADVGTGTLVGQQETDDSGWVEFRYLDLYNFGTMQYQWYAIAETDGIDGRIKDDKVIYFTLPMVGDDGTLKYDVSYEYVNGAIVNPETAGRGYGMLPIAGCAAALLAAAALGFYLFIYKRKPYRPAHMRAQTLD